MDHEQVTSENYGSDSDIESSNSNDGFWHVLNDEDLP